MPYTLAAEEVTTQPGSVVAKGGYSVQPDEGLGTTVIKTSWLGFLVGVPTLLAIYAIWRMRKAGVPLLPSKESPTAGW